MLFRSIVLVSFAASAAVMVNGQAVAPPGGCLICGDGNVVTAPDAIFTFPGQPEIPCGVLQQAGVSGQIPLDQCGYLFAFVGVCDCAPGDLPGVSTPAPITRAPVVAPTPAPVPAPTDAPVPAPIDAPVLAPVVSPVAAPVYTPVYSPTYGPSPVSSPVLSPVGAPYESPVVSPISAPITDDDTPYGGMGGNKDKSESSSSSEDASMGSEDSMGSKGGGMGKRRLFSVDTVDERQTGLIRGE